ncbi:MAG TPA: V-type ATPase 116kDa subunit family protein [Clostridia bacterium]|jgi:V/A-type H+-transporting ATPase subunit I|nr:V-type ATPase 116kDa subunit family protein [Clostridia bacterium]
MAIVSMHKMNLIAHSSEEARLMKLFLNTGYVEIISKDLLELTSYPDLKERRANVESKLLKLSFAITFLREMYIKQKTQLKRDEKEANKNKKLIDKASAEKQEKADEVITPSDDIVQANLPEIIQTADEDSRENKKFDIKKLFSRKKDSQYTLPKTNFKRENKLVKLEEYEELAKDEVDILAIVSELEDINNFLIDLKSEQARELAKLEQYNPYIDADIKFSTVQNTKATTSFFGLVPSSKLEVLKERAVEIGVIKDFEGKQFKPFFMMCHKDKAEEARTLLNEFEFSRCTFQDEKTASEVVEDISLKLTCLEKARKQKYSDAMNYLSDLYKFKVLYDNYMLELAKITCMENSPGTKKAFIMEGWVPSEKVEELTQLIEEKTKRTEVYFREPLESENPPTLTKNDKFADSFTVITNGFGVPNYRERDPAIFVALFYFLIFGIMLGDAGYGVLMSIACFAFIKIIKPVKDSGKMIWMFAFCGISTIIWGALFGSWFGVTPEKTFLRYFTWFNPMDRPLMLFVVAIAVGLLHLGTGFILKGVAEIKAKRALHGIFNQFSWAVLFIAVFCYYPNLMVFLGAINPDPVPAWYGVSAKVGTYIALVGLIMLIIGGAIGKKNPIKMVTGALGNVYGSINVVSDLLSYSRLFGLGLTSGVIGYALNMLGGIIVNLIFGGLWIGWLIAIPILVVGHTFNLGINLLGAYVHNARLHYVEFFGKFYEGSGKAFLPLGYKTKYTYLDN